jgi:site-specific DNA-methyltransferase (adenine-specific)
MTAPYYADESTTLYLGDSIDVMAGMGDQTVDAVLTDPPYSSGGRRENSRSIRKSMLRETEDDDWIRGDAMSTVGFTYLLRMCGLQWRRILKSGGHALTFIDWRMAPTLAAALETADLRQHPILVWNKGQLGMGVIFRNQHEFVVHMSAGNPTPPQRRDVPNVLTFPPVRDGDHPTEKPEPLLRTLLSVVAAPGATILDPFAGSGSALLAARSLGMKSIGVEADERFCEVIAKRFAQGDLFGGVA